MPYGFWAFMVIRCRSGISWHCVKFAMLLGLLGEASTIFKLLGEYSASIFRVIVSRELAVAALWVPPSPNLFMLGLLNTLWLKLKQVYCRIVALSCRGWGISAYVLHIQQMQALILLYRTCQHLLYWWQVSCFCLCWLLFHDLLHHHSIFFMLVLESGCLLWCFLPGDVLHVSSLPWPIQIQGYEYCG